MMMGGKGISAGGPFPLQNYYVDFNNSATGSQLSITSIEASDRVSGLVWFFVVGYSDGTTPGLDLTGETTRLTSTFATDTVHLFTYVTTGSEGASVSTTTSNLEYSQMDMYVLDPSLSGYFSGLQDGETAGTGANTIRFDTMTVNSTSDLALAFMCNNDGTTAISSEATGWSRFERPSGGGGIGGITSRWLYYIYYKDGGHASTSVSLTEGDFSWDAEVSYDSMLLGFERV